MHKRALELTLNAHRNTAQILASTGDTRTAGIITTICDDVARDAAEFLTWLTEAQAEQRSGRSPRWLRRQAHVWARDGHAYRDERGHWRYRQCVVPHRSDVADARAQGRRMVGSR